MISLGEGHDGARYSFCTRWNSNGRQKSKITVTTLAWTAIVGLAVAFVIKYVLFYYRHYDAASFDFTGRGVRGCFSTSTAELSPC